jgi:GTP-binding protein
MDGIGNPKMFIDRIKIRVEGGKGGDGCVSFRREKFVPRGGPDGGDGGKGGDVILIVEKSYKSLSHLYYKSIFKAQNGEHGKGKNLYGKNGNNLIIKVPQGTMVYKENKLIGDLVEPGESIIVAKGGKGGRGNTRFKTSTNRAPRKRECGGVGEKATIMLELKLIADIGLVGYPNVGKSTLLARISNSKPKIANYPFTTITPNLGTLNIGYKKITVADIPGIIKDAHKGKGLGLEFLRHIERTSVLIFVLDITKEPIKDYETLRNEIREYNPKILAKPSVVVLNKIDLVQEIPKFLIKKEVIPISALNGDGINKLLLTLRNFFLID